MKKITMTIREFLNFRAICERLRIRFEYSILNGMAIVRAAKADLAALGY